MGMDPELVKQVEGCVGTKEWPRKQQGCEGRRDEKGRCKEVQSGLAKRSREVVLLARVMDSMRGPHPRDGVRKSVEPVVEEVGNDQAGPPSDWLCGVREGASDPEVVVYRVIKRFHPLQEEKASSQHLQDTQAHGAHGIVESGSVRRTVGGRKDTKNDDSLNDHRCDEEGKSHRKVSHAEEIHRSVRDLIRDTKGEHEAVKEHVVRNIARKMISLLGYRTHEER